MSKLSIHPNNLCPYIISYYYKFGVSTNDISFNLQDDLQKFIKLITKSSLYALYEDDDANKDLQIIGDFDPANRLIFIQHHASSLEFPIVRMDKPIVKLGGGIHYEYITAGGTYEPHNTHRAVVRMKDNREGLMHYKWSWGQEDEDSVTYISGVIYCDLVKLSEAEYDACLESNIPCFDFLAVLQDKWAASRKESADQTEDPKETPQEKKRKSTVMETVSSFFTTKTEKKQNDEDKSVKEFRPIRL
ncbi:M [Cereal chlorotic mottle virus]|uniref:M n=1 Tax=Cereal chlorotic mottle virus TaxID=2964312 RepID=A0A976X7I3_9RHAB|nr:M [Cereal chlorotic mottle virus] [Cereal chlorotic mottle virus]